MIEKIKNILKKEYDTMAKPPKITGRSAEMQELVKLTTAEILKVDPATIGDMTPKELLNNADMGAVIMQHMQEGNPLFNPMPQSVSVNDYQTRASILWVNLIWRIGMDIIKMTRFTSAFARFVQQMETGGDIQERFINPKGVIDRNTMTNANLFTMYTDDVFSAYHRINKQWVIPTTYREFEARKTVDRWDTLTTFIASIISNLITSFEVNFQEHVKQMLKDFLAYGFFSTVLVADPSTSSEAQAAFISTVNSLSDDFRTEVNTRYTPYNNTVVPPTVPAKTIVEGTPLFITFHNIIRSTEFQSALELNFGRNFDTGNSNQDYARNIIMLNEADFPTTVTPFADFTADIPGSWAWRDTASLYRPFAFLLDPQILMLYSQFRLNFEFLNAATGNISHFFHTDILMSLSPFNKGAVIVEAP